MTLQKKISELTEDTAPTANDVVPVTDVESGTTKKVKLSNLDKGMDNVVHKTGNETIGGDKTILDAFLFADPDRTRSSLGLPIYDGFGLITNPDTVKKTGWGIVLYTAPNNPDNDNSFLFTKMINPSFGMQELNVRSTQRVWRRYLAYDVWGSWILVSDDNGYTTYTPTLLAPSGSGATATVMFAHYKVDKKTCFAECRLIIADKGTCSGEFRVSIPVNAPNLAGGIQTGAIVPAGQNITSTKGWAGLYGGYVFFTKASQSGVVQWADVAVGDEIVLNLVYQTA